MLQPDAHQAAITAATPLISQPWRAIAAAVNATLTVAILDQARTHDLWVEGLPDQIRAGNIPARLVAEIAAACAWTLADTPTVLLHPRTRPGLEQAELPNITMDVAS